MLVATLANHALAGALGAWIATLISPQVLRWILGASFIAMATWMLIPDRLADGETSGARRFGVFGTTVLAFFLAEMGDKTQIATVMLAACFDSYVGVVAGTTFGMMLANAPVVWLGERVTRHASRITHHASRAWCRCAGCISCRPSSLPGWDCWYRLLYLSSADLTQLAGA